MVQIFRSRRIFSGIEGGGSSEFLYTFSHIISMVSSIGTFVNNDSTSSDAKVPLEDVDRTISRN